MSLSYSMLALIHLHILSYLCKKNRSVAFDTRTDSYLKPTCNREFLCKISGNIGGHSNDLRSTHHHRSFFDEVHRNLTQSKLKSDAEESPTNTFFSVLEILVKMGVSENDGTQQPWVFLLKMIILGCLGGTIIQGNTQIAPPKMFTFLNSRFRSNRVGKTGDHQC